MNRQWANALCVCFLLLLSGAAGAQQCTDCDCNHFPIGEKCNNCCGHVSGQITSITNYSVVIVEKESTGDAVTVKKTFALTPETKKNANLKEGAPATVYYRKDGNVATEVDLIEKLNDLLVPADEPDPPLPSSCFRMGGVPPNALRLYLGGNLGWTTLDEIAVLEIRGIDVLDVRRTSQGRGLAINAKTYSDDGKEIAQIVDNRLYVNPHKLLRIERPDNHSIVVYDLEKRKVMDIRYLNSHSVRIQGIFQVPGAPPLVVDENEMSFDGVHSEGSCYGTSRVMFMF